MLRDVFYFNKKPNVHPLEAPAENLADARSKSRTEHFWIINEFCDYAGFDWDFDFEFLPDEDVWAEEHNNVWPSQHQKDSGTWLCPIENSDVIIYRADVPLVMRKNQDNSNWVLFDSVDESAFDFSWHPDPTDPPYIYAWGTTQYPAQLGPVIEYHVPGATDYKYVLGSVKLLPGEKWAEIQLIDKTSFDLTWRPNPTDPPYIYAWGNKWIPAELQPTIEYHVPGATDRKYMEELIDVLPEYQCWQEHQAIDKTSFDLTWRPNPTEPPYIYVWGNKWIPAELQPTIEYHVPGATDRKYMPEPVPLIKDNRWVEIQPIDTSLFDFTWMPDPAEPPYIYVWGNKWVPAEVYPTVEYHVPDATERRYMIGLADVIPEMDKWEKPTTDTKISYDYRWRPDPTSPPYIYQFGTLLDENDGPRYVVPGNDGTIVKMNREEIILEDIVFQKYKIETTLTDLILAHPGEIFWALNPDLDYSAFDFNWLPDETNVNHINAFGSKDSIDSRTYFVNGKMWARGHRDINYIEGKSVDLKTTIHMFYVDRGNPESNARFEALQRRYGNIQKTRYLNSWVDTINRCINRSTTALCWILNSELDYSSFEFDFYPSPWQMKMVHVFGTQWSHWGTTFMVNKDNFAEDTKYVKIIEHLSCLNFVKRKTAKATNCLYEKVMIDHGNAAESELITIPYTNTYLDTFKVLLDSIDVKKEHYVWVCSSVCDYSGFDFSYICDPYAKDQLHVFPSDKQKFGDTFLIDVNKMRTLIDEMTTLEDYEKINFNQHQRVKRLPAPVVITEDTHVNFVPFEKFPYTILQTVDHADLNVTDVEPMSLWDRKNILVTSTGGTRIVVPREAKKYIKKELYDYPYITKMASPMKSKPMDIVFLSNGETGAEENYDHLLKVTKGMPNRVVRVDGVNGRVAAYHASAEASNTPWAFTVFAKLTVNPKFDWSWQPDRLQIPKHYIFYATNPVNGLEYGHQAMIAYNKKIVLGNPGVGLDFTMDNEHAVIEINSGMANFNTDEFSTWRTAFREALKLRASGTIESEYRLNIWKTVAVGDFAESCLDGVHQALEYYDEVDGDMAALRLSYDWAWLYERFTKSL